MGHSGGGRCGPIRRYLLLCVLLIPVGSFASPWIEAQTGRPTPQSLDLLMALDLAERHGLQVQSLRHQFSAAVTSRQIDAAHHQVLMTLIDWFSRGQISPTRDRLWAFEQKDPDLKALSERIAGSADLLAALERLLPDHPDYLALVTQLAVERRRGPEPALASIRSLLHQGDTDAAIINIRRRLEWLGFLADDPASGLVPELYDKLLEQAVRRFQRTQGLKDDGIIGPDTLRRLNLSQQQREVQIRVALERWRWLPRQFGDQYLMVFTPGFEVRHLGPEHRLIARYKAISGRRSRPTTSFRAVVEQLVANPDWTVPRTIMRRDILPKLATDPDYLNHQQISVQEYREERWQPLAEQVLDWSALDLRLHPLRMVQQPGPQNALGQLKFHMPNPFTIYLHDTPHQELFSEAQRAFSSGCIRVQDVRDLGAALLAGRASELEDALAQPETRWLKLPRPVPVYLIYMRTWVDEAGELQMRDDIYNLDQAVADGLAQGSQMMTAKTLEAEAKALLEYN